MAELSGGLLDSTTERPRSPGGQGRYVLISVILTCRVARCYFIPISLNKELPREYKINQILYGSSTAFCYKRLCPRWLSVKWLKWFLRNGK